LSYAPALAKPEVCIRQDELYNWNALNDKQVVIENYQHRKALLTLIGPCIGLKFHETIAIKSPGGTGLSCISPGDDILVHGMGMPQRCAITSVTPYMGPPSGHHDDHHGSGDRHDGGDHD
jgi:hypothetical protein